MNENSAKKILIVDDEQSAIDPLQLILNGAGFPVLIAHSFADSARIMKHTPIDLVITKLRLPDANGIELIAHIKRETPDTEVILTTAYGSIDISIEAIKAGAYYYLERPYTPDRLLLLIERALQLAALKHENERLKCTLAGDCETFGLIGRAPQIHQIVEIINTAAPSDASVLIEGESGTGKELIASALHTQSQRASGPFIRINCAAIPNDLIESELFGYKKGAFTGADRDKRGLIEAARGGSLLLDEIAEMPMHLQTKLLRVLQERKLRRLGDEQEIDVNFRLLSATNRNTLALLSEGLLRKDLYFRVSTIKIKVPPLRERVDDIPLIAQRFLRRFSDQYGKQIRDISAQAVQQLMRYDWPGNVRELESVVERAVLFCRSTEIMPGCLPEEFQTRPPSSTFVVPPLLPMQQIEREAIMQTLERTSGNIRKSAQILQFPRPTLYRKLKKLGIKVERPGNGVAEKKIKDSSRYS